MEKKQLKHGSRRGWSRVRHSSAGRLALRFLADENGPTATEYAILLALLVLGAMGTIGSIGGSMDNIYVAITASVDAAFGS